VGCCQIQNKNGVRNIVSKDYYRGEIYHADMSQVLGHGGIQPVLVLLTDVGSFHVPTLTVAPITRPWADGNVLTTDVVLENVEGLCHKSMISLKPLCSIDKRCVLDFVGKLDREQLKSVEIVLRISLNLDEEAFVLWEMEAP